MTVSTEGGCGGKRIAVDPPLRDLVERVRARAPEYFPGLEGGVRVEVRARWQRAESDVYRLAIAADSGTPREVILKMFDAAEIQYHAKAQYQAMVSVWPRFAQHETLRIPRPLDYFPEGPAIVMEVIAGESLQTRLARLRWWARSTNPAERECEYAGRWLNYYHGPSPLGQGCLDVDTKLQGFREAIGRLGAVGVGRRHGAKWVEDLQADGEELRSRRLAVSRVHGDFTIDNLLVDGTRVAGLDVWAVDTNAIYHDMATFLNSLVLLRLTRSLSWHVLSRLRLAFLRGYFASEPWDEAALTFLQRIGLVDVALAIRRRRPSLFARALLSHVMVPAMRRLAAGAGRDS
jgi:hypothetical protein